MTSKSRIHWMTTLLLLCGLWLGADALHATWAERQWKNVAAERELTASGHRVGCEPFSVGEGDFSILFVHGFADSPALWTDMAGAFADQGFHGRAIRLEGFNGALPEQVEVTRERWREQVEDALRDLEASSDTVWIIAHSLGASVSLDALAEGAPMPDGLILIAPLFRVSGERVPIGTARGWYRFLSATTLFTDHVVSPFEPDIRRDDGSLGEVSLPANPATKATSGGPPASGAEAQEKLRTARPRSLPRHPHPRDRVLALNIYRQLFRTLDAARAAAETLEYPPVLMLLAEKDLVVDSKAAHAVFDQMNAPRKKQRIYEESGHVIPLDREQERAVQEILEFMKPPSAAGDPS